MNRPTMRLAIDEVFKTNFSLFNSYDYDVRCEQIKKINYIETIANQLEKNIHGVNLMDILKNNNNIILADDNEINRALLSFNREDYFKEIEEAKEIRILTSEESEKINTLYKNNFEQRIKILEGNKEYEMERAQTRMNQYHGFLRNARNIQDQINQLSYAEPKGLIESINEIFKDNRFEFKEFGSTFTENDTLTFVTKDDIIITHKNERAGINFRVNLGKFKFRLLFKDGVRFNIFEYENNVNYGNNYHPHVSTDGFLCLGNMSELYEEAMNNNQLNVVFDIAMQILLNYNDADPYVNISKFAIRSEQVQPDGNIAENETHSIEHECHECGEYFYAEYEDGSSYHYEDCPECGYNNEIYVGD